jgi:hypothetical protein
MLTLTAQPDTSRLPSTKGHPFARLLGWAAFSSPHLHGFASTRQPRFGGVGVHSAHTLLGLRAWRDAWEHADTHHASVIFELEKLLRMLLRQSTLAAELIAALPDLPGAAVLDHAITHHMPVAYAQSVRQAHLALGSHHTPLATQGALHALRLLLTGAVLATQHHMCVHLPTLLALWDDADLIELVDEASPDRDLGPALAQRLTTHFDAILPVLASDSPRKCLPAAPTGYDALNEFLITQRLGAS